MKLIPAIDIIDGQCVRLSQGDYNEKKVYNSDPLAVAQQFESHGIENLHLVDLDGAKAGHIKNIDVLKSISSNFNLVVDFGGGVKSDKDIKLAFESGANQVTCGSIAIKQPEKVKDWITEFGADKLILGADVKGDKIAVNGWTETSNTTVYGLLDEFLKAGMSYVICTDIATDGMLMGPSVALYKELISRYPKIKLIASGGVSSVDDLTILKDIGCYGAIIGKAIYENKISLEDLKSFDHA